MIILLLAAGILLPGFAGALTEKDFQAKTAQNIVNLCTASTNDPLYHQAVNFCHDYLVGALHYYGVQSSGPEAIKFVCPPDLRPSRNDSIGVRLRRTWNTRVLILTTRAIRSQPLARQVEAAQADVEAADATIKQAQAAIKGYAGRVVESSKEYKRQKTLDKQGATVTGLTIGYGDIVVKIPFGRVVALLIGMVGILFTGLMVAVLVYAVRERIAKSQ